MKSEDRRHRAGGIVRGSLPRAAHLGIEAGPVACYHRVVGLDPANKVNKKRRLGQNDLGP